jgi:hypothetical protein
MLTRRQLVRGVGGLAAASLLPRARPARAAARRAHDAPQPHFFLFIQVYGAWDVCLAFDPKDRDAKLPDGSLAFDQPYAMSEVRAYGSRGLRLAPAGQALGRWADRLAVVNGIDMEIDNGHVVDAIMSGFRDPRSAGLPWVQAIIAKRHPYVRRCPLPHVYTDYDGQFSAGPYVSQSITSSLPDFLAFVAPAASASDGSLGAERALIADYRASLSDPDLQRALGLYVDAVSGAIDVGERLSSGGTTLPVDVKEAADIAGFLGQLFAVGVLGSATLSFGDRFGGIGFDTHSAHYEQHPLGRALEDLATICDTLATLPLDANTSVLDRTTIVMAAEYCRTPRLNPDAGKDHNFMSNSVLLVGNRVRPGVYGASGARLSGGLWPAHAGLPIDFATGAPSADGAVLYARNFWAGLGGAAAVDLSTDFGGDTQPIAFLG